MTRARWRAATSRRAAAGAAAAAPWPAAAGRGGSSVAGSGGTGGGSVASSGGTGGTACAPVDDDNPCTDDICEGGVPKSTPTAVGSPCSMEGTLCDGLGTCVACLAPTDCSGSDDECKTRTCVARVCGLAFTAANTSVAAQTAGTARARYATATAALHDRRRQRFTLRRRRRLHERGVRCGCADPPAKANGAACSDGDACTQTDTYRPGPAWVVILSSAAAARAASSARA